MTHELPEWWKNHNRDYNLMTMREEHSGGPVQRKDVEAFRARMDAWMARARDKNIMVLLAIHNPRESAFGLTAVLDSKGKESYTIIHHDEHFRIMLIGALRRFGDIFRDTFGTAKVSIKNEWELMGGECLVFVCRTANGGLLLRSDVAAGKLLDDEMREIRSFKVERLRKQFLEAKKEVLSERLGCLSLEDCVRLEDGNYSNVNDMILDYGLINGELPESAVRVLNPDNACVYREFMVRNKLRDVRSDSNG